MPRTPSRIPAFLALLAFVGAALAARPAAGVASEWAENLESSVRLVTPWEVAPREGEWILGLHFRLAPGWHVYWKNSGDAGFPPVVVFAPADALGEPELQWPAPERYDLPGGLVAFGYGDEVVYPVRASLPEGGLSRSGDRLEITADVDYLVCEVDCIPYRYTLTLAQPLGDRAEPDPETAPLIESWRARLPRPAGEVPGVVTEAYVEAGGDRGEGGPELVVSVEGAVPAADGADLFLAPQELFETDRPRVSAGEGGVTFRVPLALLEAGRDLPARVPFEWTVTGLAAGGERFALEASREVEVRAAAPGEGEPSRGSPVGLPRALLLALLGGLLLAVTPTPLALYAAEGLALREAGGGLRRAAGALAAGVLTAAWALAALSLAAARAGIPAGWGAQLQEPAVAAALVVAPVLLALNLWGLAPLPVPAARPPRAAGAARHFVAGLFVPVLAAAWILPPLRLPVGFAAERGGAAALAVWSALGLGLAAPALLAAAFPGAARRLPTATGGARGPRNLREGLGFAAAAAALWPLYALSRQVSSEGLAWVELALLLLALLAWLHPRNATRPALQWGLALAVAALALTVPWLADLNRLAPTL